MTTTPPTPEEFPGSDAPLQTPTGSAQPEKREPVVRRATTKPQDHTAPKEKLPSTNLGRIWTATVLSIIVLALLIVFIAQNQDQVTLRYFAYEGDVNLGLALFIAAVAGAILTAAAAAARMIQLRATAKKKMKAQNKR